MNKLSVELKNCYGIKHLKTEFDFAKPDVEFSNVHAIYAPNGAMKSSFAKTFRDVAIGADSGDRIFPTRVCDRSVKDETGADIPAAEVFVVSPYDEEFGHSEKTSTLLVNNKLRLEYEKLTEDIAKAEKLFLGAMREQAHIGTKRDIKSEVSYTFTSEHDKFYVALDRVQKEVMKQQDAPWADVPYELVFDEKVLALLGTKDFKTLIDSYVKKYNELLAKSVYFKRGVFTYHNASTIAKQLAANGFFAAKHTVRLNATEAVEITTEKELVDLIQKEKDAITNDKDLKKAFNDLDSLLNRTEQCRTFQSYIENHTEVLPRLANIEAFKQDIWKSYFKARIDLYSDLLDKFEKAESRVKEIEAEALKEQTQWDEVIEIFNDRFFVPFRLEVTNKIGVMLGYDNMPVLGFTFEDGGETASIEKGQLLKSLSTGEKKALYVLNIIFEVQARQKAGVETLFVFDDVADSFDYKNKYAIIQYMHDIAETPRFRQIILTHNFDFFRTLQSRFVPYSQCYMAFKSSAGLTFKRASGIKNVFIKDWKGKFFENGKKRIASIPFMRNIVEYTKGETDPAFGKLTSLLHWKSDTETITQADLDAIYSDVFGPSALSWPNAGEPVCDLLKREAQDCLSAADGVNFENKIVLAIAIRLTAERYMIAKIADSTFAENITETQTQKLLGRFKRDFPGETGAIAILNRVGLMTPENIHLNSFMYEPILDMSDEHLRKLYAEVRALT